MNDADFLWKLIIISTAVGNVFVVGITIVSFFRRVPPLDSALEALRLQISQTEASLRVLMNGFVLKRDCTREMQIHDAKRAQVYANFNARMLVGDHDFQEIRHALGRIEGSQESQKNTLASLTERVDSLYGKLVQ